MKKKPNIIVHFRDGGCEEEFTCTWFSDGWNEDSRLMNAAREAIRAGNTPSEVIALLRATFQVVRN